MKGLLLKDLLGMKSFFKIFLVILAICLVPAFSTQSGDFSAGFACTVFVFIGGMIGFTSFAYDKAYGWDSYVLTLPYTRKQIVLSKYLFSLLITGIGAALGIGVNLILMATGIAARDADVWPMTGLVLCMVVIFISIMIPLMFRYGAEKARIIVIAIFLVPFMLFVILGGEHGADGLMDVINAIITWLPFIAAAVLVMSWLLSVRIYSNKEE